MNKSFKIAIEVQIKGNLKESEWAVWSSEMRSLSPLWPDERYCKFTATFRCLLSIHKNLGSIHSTLRLSVTTHTCNPAPRRKRQEDQVFKVMLCNVASLGPAWVHGALSWSHQKQAWRELFVKHVSHKHEDLNSIPRSPTQSRICGCVFMIWALGNQRPRDSWSLVTT